MVAAGAPCNAAPETRKELTVAVILCTTVAFSFFNEPLNLG